MNQHDKDMMLLLLDTLELHGNAEIQPAVKELTTLIENAIVYN